jgi:hypothetical protein
MRFQPSPLDRRPPLAFGLALVLLVLALPGWASATVYYVDPSAGANGNNGTAAATPWLNPPGTRKSDNSGFSSATWGAISTSNKIKCGDVVLLKGGSTQTSSQGGAWWISPSYYTATCTAASRITIRIAASGEWSGSTGPFTINGSGVTPAADATYGVTDHNGLINVNGVNFIEVKGLSNSQRIVFTNSSDRCISIGCSCGCGGGTCASMTGFRGDWWDLNNSNFGFDAGRANDWQVSNATGELLKNEVWGTGMNNDLRVDQAAFVNVTAHDSGCGSAGNPSCTSGNGVTDQFFFVGGRNVWCVNCTTYNAGERGVNTGVIQDANMGGDFVYHFRNLISYGNGTTCKGSGPHFCSAAGIDTSGNDWASSDVSRNFIVGAILYGNPNAGEGTYGSGYQEVWHAVAYNNGTAGGANHRLRAENHNQMLFNSIDPIGSSYDAGTANGSEPQKQFTPTALNNCYRPHASDSESLGANFGGWPGSGTYASPPAWISAATNKIGLAGCNPQFVNLAANDVHLQVASVGPIDTGRFFLLANGAGSSSTTITVQANGGSGDPRYYFIQPSSYLDAVADTIQIQNATCTSGTPALQAGQAIIASMTATTITLDRTCSWTSGAGIHLPWSGSAPDMGAFEFTSGPPAPLLLSVAVAPTPTP